MRYQKGGSRNRFQTGILSAGIGLPKSIVKAIFHVGFHHDIYYMTLESLSGMPFVFKTKQDYTPQMSERCVSCQVTGMNDNVYILRWMTRIIDNLVNSLFNLFVFGQNMRQRYGSYGRLALQICTFSCLLQMVVHKV